MQSIGGQVPELRLTQMKERLVISSFHVDLRLGLDAVVDDEIEPVARADGRNSSLSAVREQPIDLGFVGHVDIPAESCPQFR
jgi:hypothetical protein